MVYIGGDIDYEYFSIGSVYDVFYDDLSSFGSVYYRVRNDLIIVGSHYYIEKHYFVSIEEYRDKILNELGI